MLLVEIKDCNLDYIHKWDFKNITHNCRIYFKPNSQDEDSGFNFHVINFDSAPADGGHEYILDHPEVEVEILYHGVAYFDGIRHMYMGSNTTDNEGYVYYPNMLRHIKIMRVIRDLEVKYCWDHEPKLY